MNRLVYILLFMLMAATVSCHRTSEAEARLIAIDSLIPAAPDSALALLEAIDTTSLRGEMRAYHALLTAQALYKAYIPATSDSLINRAWDYYKDHGSYDRRIRAMLYKGTTAEELGHPDTAMYWYKRTELESRPDDHYHRGYALMAIAELYKNAYYTKDAIRHYREAIASMDALQESLSLFCAQQLSQLYLEENPDSAILFINRIEEYIQSSNDSTYLLTYLICKDKLCFFREQYEESKNEVRAAIDIFGNRVPFTCWYHLVVSYVKLNKPDSADYYLSIMPAPSSIQDSVFYFEMLQVISQHHGHLDEALNYEKASNNLSDKILTNDNEYRRIEEQAIIDNASNIPVIKLAICFLILVSIISVLLVFIRKQKNIVAQEQVKWLNDRYNEAQTRIENLQNEYLQLVNTNKKDDVKLKLLQSDNEIMKLLNANMKSAFDNCISPLGDIAADYYEHGANASRFIERFNNEFQSCWREQDFWTAIEQHINQTRNNAIERITSVHHNITTSELRLIMLTILDFDATAITICLGYRNPNVLYSMKNKLKKKLGIRENTLDGYLKLFISQEQSNNL